ncbi:MAG: hypothetical protein N838_22005 [Thiohalocapsa sp. PB-PSB1]|jgi:hypothetical protein|nr:MAG: hypothetical protein N838_20620 [Thiohalocapsa sp. PB-PSB1]QQO55619.1 MAG: hypothetical protein N838_22005 [Thiohalocapsa sp. PB-PSB1]HCS89859.1 hypothetical protein [Chromatiaceae bacterium]
MLLPPRVEDFVDQDNLLRAIAAYVHSCDLAGLGLTYSVAVRVADRQPAYDPRDLLKLSLYGDMNRIRSGHRLEQECQRNIELIWLLGGLRAGYHYHSMTNFRRDNAKALKVRQGSGAGAHARLKAVSFIHRFGASLNHRVHYHCCVIDGVFEPVEDAGAVPQSVRFSRPPSRHQRPSP